MGISNWTPLLTLSLFIGLMVVVILVFSRDRKTADLLLAAYLGCLILLTLHTLLIEWSIVETFPNLFRFPRPIMYLACPLIYLYVRRVAYQEIRFRRYDLLFLLPTLIQIVFRIPYFFLPEKERLEIIRFYRLGDPRAFETPKGLIPEYMQPFLIEAWSMVFIGMSIRILFSLRRQKNRYGDYQNRLQIRWLTLLVSINLLQIFLFIYHLFAETSMVENIRYLTIEIAVILLVVSVALFFHPSILYGFKGREPMLKVDEQAVSGASESEGDGEPSTGGYVLSSERRAEIIRQIQLMMEDRMVYLQKGYSIRHLGQDTGLPFNYLSQVINQEYGMNFNEWINSYRIRHFKKLYADPANKGFTLEALAEKSGFSSRATFARSFLRVDGVTPREFIRQQMTGHNDV